MTDPRVNLGTLASRGSWRADLAAMGLGALSALALPPIHLVPVLLLAVPGLLILIRAAASARMAARRGWWFGFGLNLLGLYWITEAILVEAARYWWLVPLAVPALSAALAAFVAVPAAATRRLARGELSAVFALAALWTFADIARQFVLSGFPWNLWGTVWAIPGLAGDVLLQPAAVVGTHGLGLATLIFAGAPIVGRRAAAPVAVVLLAWGGLSAARLSLPAPAATGLDVVLVQGNVEQGQKWDRARALEIFRRYLDLTAEGIARIGDTPAVVVWPETASPFPLLLDPDARAAIAAAAQGRIVLAGSVRWGQDRRPRNSLVPILPDGQAGEVYDKWHLVPFGEVQPDWFPLPIQIVPGGGFAAGPGPRTLHLPGLPPVGPLICYEAIFGGEIVDRADRPAWLVNVTNDAWFGRSSGPYQHLAAARLRAVEEALPVIRAANTGISAVYDGFGHELGRLGLGVQGSLAVALPGVPPPTVFAHWGIGIAALLSFAALMLSLIVDRSRN